MKKRRIIFVPDDYREACDLGWIDERDRAVLDTGRHLSDPGQVWVLDDGDVATIPAPAK